MAALSTKIENRTYAPLEALVIIKENANAKFDETIEAHIGLGIDPKYTDQQLRTTVALPNGTGQSIKIAVITSGENVSKAKSAGADLYGEEDLVESINKRTVFNPTSRNTSSNRCPRDRTSNGNLSRAPTIF